MLYFVILLLLHNGVSLQHNTKLRVPSHVHTPSQYFKALNLLEQQNVLRLHQTEAPKRRQSAVQNPAYGETVDILAEADDYKGTTLGLVTPQQPFPETEGYAPPLGYYQQSEECDGLMTLWFNDCLYHVEPTDLYPPPKEGEEPKTAAEFIGEILKEYTSKLTNRERNPPYANRRS